MEEYIPSNWKEFEDENGDLFVVMDDAHQVFIGNLEDTCNKCHTNSKLIANAPKLLLGIKKLLGLLDSGASIYDEEVEEIRFELEATITNILPKG